MSSFRNIVSRSCPLPLPPVGAGIVGSTPPVLRFVKAIFTIPGKLVQIVSYKVLLKFVPNKGKIRNELEKFSPPV